MRRPQLTLFECGQAIAWKGILSIETIAKKLDRDPTTISRLFQRYEKTGTHQRKSGSGRPRKTTPREDRRIVREAQSNRRASSRSLKQSLSLDVSPKTIRNRLHEVGIRSYWTTKKPFISETNRKRRIAWAKKHIHWTKEQWHQVLWSDESPFTLRYQGKRRVWRSHNERYLPECTTATVKHDKKVNVWGCFSAQATGDLHLVQGNLEQRQFHSILVHHMRPSADRIFGDSPWIFQQDNDPKHTAKINQQYLANKKIKVLDWPAQSPDLNPIENLWSILGHKLRDRTPTSTESLMQLLQHEWNQLPTSLLQGLVDSMPQKVPSCPR